MAKNQPTGIYDPTTGAFVPVKKKKKIWPWIVGIVAVFWVIGIISGIQSRPAEPEKNAPETEAAETPQESEAEPAAPETEATAPETKAPESEAPAGIPEPEPETEPEPAAPDFSDVPTEYTLTAGQYYAGIDIPCGKFNLTAVSGSGNVSSSNIYSGGINGLYAKPGDGPDYYKEAYNGIKLPEGERIEICSNLVVKIEYTRIDAGFSGRTEDEANKITLIDGNYDIGDDIPAGLYTIRVTDGSGNVSCNVYGGGLNEIMGAPGTDQSILAYIPEFKNAYLPAGEELTIRGMTVDLIPMIPGLDG